MVWQCFVWALVWINLETSKRDSIIVWFFQLKIYWQYRAHFVSSSLPEDCKFLYLAIIWPLNARLGAQSIYFYILLIRTLQEKNTQTIFTMCFLTTCGPFLLYHFAFFEELDIKIAFDKKCRTWKERLLVLGFWWDA